MKQKSYLTLDDEFIQYCKLNNIEDVEKYAKEIFNKAFTLVKYGDKPNVKVEPKKPEIIETQLPVEEPKIVKPLVTNTGDLYSE